MIIRTTFLIVLAFLVAPLASAQLISSSDEWFGVLDGSVAERGFTITTQSRQALIGIRPGVLPGPTRAFLRLVADAQTAPQELPPRDGMRYASGLYYYEFFDIASLQDDLVVALRSAPLARRGGVYLFDNRAHAWFPLKTVRAANNTSFRAFSDVLSGYLAVLEYENDDAELLSLMSAARAVVASDGDDHLYVAHHSRDVYPIASLTKLMTALVFLDHNPGWNARITIQKQDDSPPAKIPFRVGDVVIVRALFESMLVGSKNNGANALSRATGMSRQVFVKEMNAKARSLGMEDTVFTDVSGLSSGNKGSSRDIAILARAALGNSDIRSAAGKTRMDVGLLNRTQTFRVTTTNDLVATGIKTLGKTGYLPEVGYNLALMKYQGGKPLVFVILGAPSSEERFELGKKLLERPW